MRAQKKYYNTLRANRLWEEKKSNGNLRKLCAVKSQGFKADRGTYAAT